MARSFSHSMLKLGSRGNLASSFHDFVTWAFKMNQSHNLDSFLKLPNHNRRLLIECWSSLLLEMSSNGNYKDVLGDFQCKYIGSVNPIPDQRIADMLPGLCKSTGKTKRVVDLECSTGRKLLAVAKFDPSYGLFGISNVITDVQITLLNLCIYRLSGEIALGEPGKGLWIASWKVCKKDNGRSIIVSLAPDQSILNAFRWSLQNGSKFRFDF